jgi:hypothetical protein
MAAPHSICFVSASSTLNEILDLQKAAAPWKRFTKSDEEPNGIGLRRDCFTLPQGAFARRGLSR